MGRRAWATVGAVGACAAAVVAVLAWEAQSSSPEFPCGVLAAQVYSDELDGCREVLKRVDHQLLSTPDTEGVEADHRYAAQLLDDGRGIRVIGISSCGDVQVVSISVATYRASVLAVLPSGTAVVAY